MKKKIFYAILICVIIAGCVVIGTMGLNADIAYSKSVKIDVYLGKEYNHEEVKQIAKETFGRDRVLIQQVEYYGDMFSLTISQKADENMDEKIELLNNKINEKYELENRKEDIQVTYQPKIKLSSIITPYIVPLAISIVVIIVYALIRFRKIGILRTFAFYILTIVVSEAVYLSLLAITRFPINRVVVPVGLCIYVLVITVVTAIQEKKLAAYRETEDKRRK